MVQKRRNNIPVRRMDAQTPLGIEFSYRITGGHNEMVRGVHADAVHRDDYYMFLFLEKGEGLLIVDFEEIELKGNSVLYIRPGQVHYAAARPTFKAEGWFLAMDAALVEKDYKNIFEGLFLTQRPIAVNDSLQSRMAEIAHLLRSTMQAETTPFSNGIITNLANVFIGNIAEKYAVQPENLKHDKSRSAQIAHGFKNALSQNYKTIKSPAEYAKMLNYSLAHLNESVKATTGFPVSYWIHQQVILEAKRLLYHTDMDVKEIAFSLGYEDHTYFSRLFSKIVGVSPGAFRRKFRE